MGNDEMTDLTLYWIWLSQGVGFASPKPKQLLYSSNNIKELYNGGEMFLRYSGMFSKTEIKRLCSNRLSFAENIVEQCEKLGYSIIDISEEAYPETLRNIENPPAVLYVNGKLPDVDTLDAVSVIGTRKATNYGVRIAFRLGADLAREDFVIVSGGALGIDCAAHRGALHSQGKTICVLGCGIDCNYLMENKLMREQIAENGAVISEYPPGTPANGRNFPQRNRIISGLSKGTIVVEAPKASGSLITVNYALSQSRDVFSVMGNVDSVYSEGTNELIKEGAIPVTGYSDVLEYYRGVDSKERTSVQYSDSVFDNVPVKLRNNTENSTGNTPVPTHKDTNNLSDDERKVYYLLGMEPMHVDEISQMSQIPIHVVLRILSTLEINDLIVNTSGRNYAIK